MGPLISVEEDLRIDGHEELLTAVGWMGVSPSGVIAMILPDDHAVRFYDASGRALGSVGREGDGPGEFQRPRRGGWLGDTLWVYDTQLGRVTLVRPDLTVARTVPHPPRLEPSSGATSGARSYSRMTPYALYPGGLALVEVHGVVDGPPLEGEAGSPLVRTSLSGEIIGEVVSIPESEEGLVTLESGGRPIFGSIPFYPHPAWAVSPDGSRVAILVNVMPPDRSGVRIEIVDAVGSIVVNRVIPLEAVPIPEAVLDSTAQEQASRGPVPALQREMAEALKQAAPEVYPLADRILLGSDGRIWIGLGDGAERNSWLVLDENGELLGSVTLPDDVMLLVATATHVYGIERDEVGVESVVRFSLQRRVS